MTKRMQRKRKLYRLKRISDNIGSILIGIALIMIIGLAGAVDMETMGGAPVDIISRLLYTAIVTVFGAGFKLLSWYIE